MDILKLSSTKIKIMSAINLIVLILSYHLLQISKIELLPYLIVGYICYFLLNILLLIRNLKSFKQKMTIYSHSFSKKIFHFLSHFLLPIIEILSFWAVMFFIKIPLINYILIIIQSYIFFILLTNVYAYFRKTHVIEHKTQYIYDILSLFTVFIFFFALYEAKQYWGLNQIIVSAISLLYLFFFIVTENIRYDRYVNLKLQLLFIVGFLIVQVFVYSGIISNLRTTIILTMLTYLYLNVVYHFKNYYQVNSTILIEYGLILTIAIVIMLEIIP